jgi:predicted RND superfamily exporter protein
MHPRVLRIERLLTRRNARLALVALGLVSLFFAFTLRNVRLDHDFERFFPTDDPELDRYLAYRERFGHDNDLLLIAASHAPSVFDRAFLVRVDSLAARLERLPNVEDLLSPTRLTDPRVTPVGVFQVPWLRLEHDSTLAADSARIQEDERVRNGFFSQDCRSLLLVLRTAPVLSKERSDALMEDVQRLVDQSGLEEVRIGGRIHGQYWYIQKMWREMTLFFSLSVALLTLFLALGFRTLWGVLVPIGVVALTVLWQVGLITLFGQPLTVLTMLLPTILFVVGMSDVVHILERYIEALRNGHPKERALALSYHEVGLATFLTSLTTAIGFAALLTSGIAPVREFGVITAAGVFLAFGLSFTLLPAVLLLVRTPVQARDRLQDDTWYRLLHGLFRVVMRHRRLVPWLFVAISAVSVAGVQRLKVDNQLLEDWPEDDPQKQDYYWFEEHFGGVRPFEIEVSVLDTGGTVWAPDVMRAMDRVQDHLEREYGVSAVISPVTVAKALNKALNGGDKDFHRLPDDDAELARLAKRAHLLVGREAMGRLVTPDGLRARMSGRTVDRGGHEHARRNAVLERFLAEAPWSARVDFHQTGMAYLIDRSNERLSGQLIGGLSMAFLLIAAIMALVFRDVRMTLVALLPNTVPLLMVGGFMGFSGIDIKVSTAIIFTIAFGIAVDDTIHMLGKLRIELNKGKPLVLALRRAFLSAGRALIVTTIMLLSGFASLVFSGFASVRYMGLLVGLTLLAALLADLVLLPVLVLWLRGRRR